MIQYTQIVVLYKDGNGDDYEVSLQSPLSLNLEETRSERSIRDQPGQKSDVRTKTTAVLLQKKRHN